jgi:hydantoinase/carbamoylase family amidase
MAPAVHPARVIADLRELQRRTSGAEGAERVCWTDGWARARELLEELLGEIGLDPEIDEAGNAWAELAGADGEAEALLVGSHLDSVPGGGWLDGALGVMAALGVLRAWAESDEVPPRPLKLVDWADEEGAFGRSLLGSAAVAGSLDVAELEDAKDASGRAAAEAMSAHGVEIASMLDAGGRLDDIGAYLELHIEQGPALEARGASAAAVTGCAGLERLLLRFTGAASHAGTTPMGSRRDAGLAAAATALDIERIATASGGVGTTGQLRLQPGAMTVIPGGAEMSVDLRHPEAAPLAEMLDHVVGAAADRAGERGCALGSEHVWSIEPIAFDAELVELAEEACAEVTGERIRMASGALHDAAEVARLRPTAMIFTPSIDGVSHSPREDTGGAELARAIEAFGLAANRRLAA